MTPNPIEEYLFSKLSSFHRTAYRPIISEKNSAATASKFGGMPWLSQGEAWPMREADGEPMQLLLQLNLDELPKTIEHDLGSGLLQLFYAAEAYSLQDFDEGDMLRGSYLARVVQYEDRETQAVQPPDFDEPISPLMIVGWETVDDYPGWPEAEQQFGLEIDEELLGHLRDSAVIEATIQRIAELGGCDRDEIEGFIEEWKEDIESEASWGSDALKERLRWLSYSFNLPLDFDKLMGWPHWIQDIEYPSCPHCGNPMNRLLFQFSAGEHLDTSAIDGDTAYLVQCPQHPHALRFSWQC